jgi:hypothetical protein
MDHIFHPPFAERLRSFFDAAPDSITTAAGYMSEEEHDKFYSELKKSNPQGFNALGPRNQSPFKQGRAAILKYPTPKAEKWAVQNGGRYGLKVDPENPWLVRPVGDAVRGKKEKLTTDDLLETALGDMFYKTESPQQRRTSSATGQSRGQDYSPEDWPTDSRGIADAVFALAMRTWNDIGIATTMTAVALKESGGRSIPSAVDNDSRGLWQINVDVHEQPLIDAGIIETADDLWDPEVNAKAAEYVGRGSNYRSHAGSVDLSRWSVTHGGASAPYLEAQAAAVAARNRAGISGAFRNMTGDWDGRSGSSDERGFGG